MNLFTVDVEDWYNFQFGGFSAPISQWSDLESRIDFGVDNILYLLERHNKTAVFFVLGWIAERYPHLVRKIWEKGHKIGCHSYSHQKVNNLGPKELREEVYRGKSAIENILGKEVDIYRAPEFSVSLKNRLFFEILIENGFKFDSSIFIGKRIGGSLEVASPEGPYRIETMSTTIIEIPIVPITVFGLRVPIFGGGYFRISPIDFILWSFGKMDQLGKDVVFYLHPHDIDKHQPRVLKEPLSRMRRYIGLNGATKKLEKILEKVDFLNFDEYESKLMSSNIENIKL